MSTNAMVLTAILVIVIVAFAVVTKLRGKW